MKFRCLPTVGLNAIMIGRIFMVGVYFSGTGNTKYCIEKLLKALDGGAVALPIEDPTATDAVKNADEIVFAYPVYYSNCL